MGFRSWMGPKGTLKSFWLNHLGDKSVSRTPDPHPMVLQGTVADVSRKRRTWATPKVL